MPKKKRKTKTRITGTKSGKDMTPVMQLGVVFIIVAAMALLMYAARLTP